MENEHALKLVSVVTTLPTPVVTNSSTNKTLVGEPKVSEPSELKKRESLEQLSTNALAPYKPDLSDFENPESIKMYSCCHCGDTYICKPNFEFHMNRKSVLIHFECDSCESPQVFYNRCRLLSHIATHMDVEESSDIRKAIVSPLPRIMMDGIHNDFVKSLEIEDLDDDQGDREMPTFSKLLEVSLCEDEEQPSTSSPIKTIPKVEPKTENIKRIQCSECQETFENADERKEHFINNNKIPITIILCSKCGILCPTECSSKAHKRLHLQISPYVCPECGDNPDRYWENFQKHLRYQCLHYSRIMSYKCPLCITLCHSLESLKKHTLLKHILPLLKCQACPMAFKSFASFSEHKKKPHGIGEIKYDMIFKCLICENVYLQKDATLGHMDLHLKNTCQYVFKCPECNAPFIAKEILHEHMQKQHLKIYSDCVIGGNCTSEINTNEENASTKFNCSKIECLLCHCAFSSHQGYSQHIARSHSFLSYPCGICGAVLRLRAERIMHGKNHLRNDIPLCLLCHNKPMTETETIDMHLLYHVERIKYRTMCVVCGKGLFNFKDALQHLRSEHYLRNSVQIDEANVRGITSNEQKQAGDNINDGATSDQISFPMKRAFSETVYDVGDQDSSSSSSSSSAKKIELESGRCYKCGFVCDDRAEFKAHILTHKPTPECFQCMECGQSYITEPTLKLHLKVHHHILDGDKYVEKEGHHYVSEKGSSQDVTRANALECTVCFENFASDTLLRSHMRSHGMAFIQAKKGSIP